MKILPVLFFSLILSLSLSAQEKEEAAFVRKGRVLVEVGSDIFGGFGGGGGTGSSILFGGGGGSNAITNFSFDGGYFISENFAIKARFGILANSNGFGTSTSFLAGGKYYINGKVPVELGLGFLTLGNGFGSAFSGNAKVGYAIPLAKNINFEPSLGVLIVDDAAIGQFSLGFSLFL